MRFELSAAQVLDLAPDPPSRKAGQGLGRAAGWVLTGQDECSAWGEIKGSGSAPYRTSIDANGLATKCTCPSRKFPCKHALGLMLVLASSPGAVPSADAPEWVSAWVRGRGARAAAAANPKPVDEKAQAKRRDAREQRISDGVAELSLWLSDLLHRGLASARAEGAPFWDRMAARLVDAQAPGLARRVRMLPGLARGDDWESRLAESVGRLVLLCEAWKRAGGLPPETLANLQSAVGLPATAEQLAACPGIDDGWTVLALRFEEGADGIRSREAWLAGAGTGRVGYILDFSAAGRAFPPVPPPGHAFRAEMVPHPGWQGRRLSIRTQGATCAPDGFSGASGAAPALAEVTAEIAAAPWSETWPMRIRAARLGQVRAPGVMYAEQGGIALPLADHPANLSMAVAASGNPVDLFGLWDGWRLGILAAGISGRLYTRPETGDSMRRAA